MVLKLLSRGFSSVLASPVRFGVGCLHQASSGFYWPGSAGLIATVNPVFWPFLSCRSGFPVILEAVLTFPLVSRLHASSIPVGRLGKPF